MPELPEVETSRRGIEPYCRNQIVSDIILREHRLRWPVDRGGLQPLIGKRIAKVERRAKYLLIGFEDTPLDQLSLMIHLGMSGSLRILNCDHPPAKHDHFDLILASQQMVRFNDPRRFGSIIINRQGSAHPLLVKLGPEPLSADFNLEYLHKQLSKRSIPIKAALMDNHLVVGVGNIYAQESLFLAGIQPLKPANQLTKKQLLRLIETIRSVLSIAIEAGGSSLKDFTHADGKPGYFQHQFQVYGRGGQACNRCGSPITQLTISQRTTCFCPKCQK